MRAQRCSWLLRPCPAEPSSSGACDCQSHKLREPWAFSLGFAKGLEDHSRYNVTIGSSTSILGPNIPASTKDTFVSHLASYNMWALQGERGWAGSSPLRLGQCGGGSSPQGRRVTVIFFSCSECGGLSFKSAGQALTCFCHRQGFSSVPLMFRI